MATQKLDCEEIRPKELRLERTEDWAKCDIYIKLFWLYKCVCSHEQVIIPIHRSSYMYHNVNL